MPLINKGIFSGTIIDFNNAKYYPTNFGKEIDFVLAYLKTKNKNKSEQYLFEYNRLIKNILSHNQALKNIEIDIKDFDFDKILANPLIYDLSNVSKFEHAYQELSQYKECYGIFQFFKENYIDTISNLLSIQKQYQIVQEVNKIKQLDDKYIDDNEKEEIISRYVTLNALLHEFPKLYYCMIKPNFADDIKKHNEEYYLKHKDDPFFDNINNKSLDEEQRKAVLDDEVSNLVIAGAGSGKTLTIVAKTKFLLQYKKIKPEEILLLSYSKKSSEDLQIKMNEVDERLTVGTFHKLGLDILKEHYHKSFAVEEQFNAIVEQYFREELIKNRNKLIQIIHYFGLYFHAADTSFYNDEGELFKDLKREEFTTLKDQLNSFGKTKYETLKKEKVKSQEELVIANYYLLNGIKYEYEKPYEIDLSTQDKRQYLPDFYLSDYGVYHEHYGVDRNNNAAHFGKEAGKKYVESMIWKKQVHAKYQTKCIKTYSYNFKEKTIIDVLNKQLDLFGVKRKPLNDKEVYDIYNSICMGQSYKSFINLLKTFISLYKARYKDETSFDTLLKYNTFDNFNYVRAKHFISIAKDIYMYYMKHIREEGKIDFDDMILKSKEVLPLIENYKYKYIIVDEFQDISFSRMEFLKALIEHGNSKLFAVGDDWQAIYRFSGCDLNIFLNFDKYFGTTKYNRIQITHRNSLELQNIVGPFIKRNPHQIAKTIRSDISLFDPVKIRYYSSKEDKSTQFINILKNISEKDEYAKVLILGRNNRDYESICSRYLQPMNNFKNEEKIFECSLFPKMKLTYSTVHASKGLEEDFVILINNEDNKYGFPNKVEDDVLLSLVLSDSNEVPFAEERRLFYVSLTRTRSYCYLLVNAVCPSIFVKEIEIYCEKLNEIEEETEDERILCPRCKSGHLVKRYNKSTNKPFLGCSNYPYCSYTTEEFKAVENNLRCPVCGDFLKLRNGRYGYYYKCTNKHCGYKQSKK